MTDVRDARDANLLGAFIVAANDRFTSGLAMTGTSSTTRAAALTSLRDYPGLTVDALSTTLGITGSGGTRLIAGMIRDDLVRKEQAADGRAVALHLTRRGRKSAAEVSRIRQDFFAGILAGLSPGESAAFARLCEKILPTLGSGQAWEDHSCRFCDVSTCPQDRCPVACTGVAE
jgi:DNA-binding MarR family transcriptional regulator